MQEAKVPPLGRHLPTAANAPTDNMADASVEVDTSIGNAGYGAADDAAVVNSPAVAWGTIAGTVGGVVAPTIAPPVTWITERSGYAPISKRQFGRSQADDKALVSGAFQPSPATGPQRWASGVASNLDPPEYTSDAIPHRGAYPRTAIDVDACVPATATLIATTPAT